MPTWPGINHNFALDQFRFEEQGIIERFSKYFYVTRSIDPIHTGNSSHVGFLMRPSDGISTFLNVEREIAVIFADYETFEARTLTAYNKIYDSFDDERIDKTVRILISRDSKIIDKIRHYIAKDPEYPVIIPYRYDQFNLRTDNFIIDAIRSNYLTRDLFGYQSPLKQEYFFFGRDKLVNHVVDVHKAGQNSSLFGLRKSGKTSTIYAVLRRAKALHCNAITIDCQDPAVHAKKYSELLLFIVNQVRVHFNMKARPEPLGDKPDQVSEQFRLLMVQLLKSVKSDILVIFDEIENISPRTAASPHWRAGHETILFWQTLRAFFQQSSKYKMTFCFVGTNPHLFETAKINDTDNPVYMFAPKTYLPPLSLDDVREMCRRLGYFMGLDFDSPIVGKIHQQFGGHPFFVRQLCSLIHQREPLIRPVAVSLAICNEAASDGATTTRSYLRDILQSLKMFYPDEYDLLQYLASGNVQTFNEIVSDYPEFVEHLVGYGIITKRGREYDFMFDGIQQAILSAEEVSRVLSVDEMRIEVGRRRNKLEEEIRVALYHWSNRLSREEWEEACHVCVPKQIERIGPLPSRQMFARTQSPLYFLDLMAFVDFSNSYYQSSDKSTVKKAFNLVNKLRIDAHAKSMSSDDYREWAESMAVLEDIFIPPE